MTLAARFWSKVDKSGPVATLRPDLGPCWLWTAGKSSGYGVFYLRHGQPVRAHRWAWEEANGPIPEGLELDHFACEVPACVNPTHVRPVSPRENQLRSNSISARNAAKTHCPKGHPYSGDNLYIIPSTGGRMCRECFRLRRLKRR